LVVTLLIIAALAAGWWYLRGLSSDSPRFNSILIEINHEAQKLLPGEALTLHPSDRVKISKVATTVPLNVGIRLVSTNFDVNALRYEKMTLSDLLPRERIFEHYNFRIRVKHENQELGHIDWEIRPYAEDWLDRANRIIDGDQRLAFLERAHRLHPENKEIQRRLLDEYKSLARWEKASSMLEDMAREGMNREILTELLAVYTAMGSREGVVTTLERLVQVDPDDLEARSRLAEVLEEEGNLSAAIEAYEGLLKQLEPEERIQIYKRLGYLHTETGRYKKAISFYLKAANLDQKDANLYYNLAYLYEKINDQDKADFYLGNAVTLNTEDLEGRLKLAQSLIEKGSFKKAEKYLSEVLTRDPRRLDALLMMARVLEDQENRDELIKTYEKILALEPGNTTILYNLGVLEFEKGDFKTGLAHLTEYLKSHPEDFTARSILFEIYRKQGKTERAYKEAEALTSLRPEDVGPYHYIFEALKERKDYEAMIPIMERGVQANPGEASLREYLILAYLETGQEETAIKQMEELLKLKPKDEGLWLGLARLQEKKGRYSKALKAYKRVLELSPGHEEAEESYLKLRLKSVKDEGAS